MPYTSRHEITVAVESTVREALHAHPDTQSYVIALYDDGRIFSALYLSHITEETIEKQLMTSKAGIPPLDIVVRTSGVKRLSDFMLWQVGVHLSRGPCMVDLCSIPVLRRHSITLQSNLLA